MTTDGDIKNGSIDVQLEADVLTNTESNTKLLQRDFPSGTVLAVLTEDKKIRFTHLYRGVGHTIVEYETSDDVVVNGKRVAREDMDYVG